MARKKAKQIEEPDDELLRHIRDLGLENVDEYRDWCVNHGFSKRLKKHWRQLGRERFYVRQELAKSRLKNRKREKRNLVEVVRAICSGELGADDVTEPHLKLLCAVVSGKANVSEPLADTKSLIRLLTPTTGTAIKTTRTGTGNCTAWHGAGKHIF